MQETHAVTGAFGFSGRYIAERLLNAGHKVVTFTNSPDRASPLQGKVAVRPFCFDSEAALVESLHDVDVFYNTYWVRFNSTASTIESAVQNSTRLFSAAKKAGVARFVHISICGADSASPFEYIKGKGRLEEALKISGLSYAIVRPAALFGSEGILINNIAWALRNMPVFACFGNCQYHIQPIYVDDLAAIMAEQGTLRENTFVYALGQQDFMYRDLIKLMGELIGCQRPVMRVPAVVGYWASKLIGGVMRDQFATREEIGVLMADLLHAPGVKSTAPTLLSSWLKANSAWLGTSYMSEMGRRRDLRSSYTSIS